MADKVWSDLHAHYQDQDWIDKPNLFAQTAIKYFPQGARILELGAGQGQDTRYFADHGFHVVSTDLEQDALNISQSKLSTSHQTFITTQSLDLRHDLPFDNESFDVVYAHLSLHYFDRDTTARIFDEISRVLKPAGVLAFFVNSTSDPEFGTGTRLEADYFQLNHTTKRYFNIASARDFTRHWFDTMLLDNLGETYKDAAKGVHNLIRFVGTKKPPQKPAMDLPFVGAIIERRHDGKTQILMQTRHKPQRDPVYTGTLGFPAGKLDVPFENAYDALGREIKEETGLTLKSVTGDSRTRVISTNRNDSVLGFRPYCCTQQLKNGQPWIGFIFRCEVEDGEPTAKVDENRDVHWMDVDIVHELFLSSPERLFSLELPAWEYYFNEKGSHS